MATILPRLGPALAIALPVAAFAQASASPPPGTMLNDTDKHFMTTLAAGNMAEIKLSQIALDHARSQDVKSFAQHMVDDHTRAGDQLGTLAAKDGVTLPGDLDAAHQKDATRLDGLNGAGFDHAYVDMMVKDHDKTVGAFKQELSSGRDKELLDWTRSTLPTIQSHDTAAKKLQKGTSAM